MSNKPDLALKKESLQPSEVKPSISKTKSAPQFHYWVPKLGQTITGRSLRMASGWRAIISMQQKHFSPLSPPIQQSRA